MTFPVNKFELAELEGEAYVYLQECEGSGNQAYANFCKDVIAFLKKVGEFIQDAED